MSSLKYWEIRSLEKALEMHSWFVLDFSDRTFWDFILDHTSLNIHDQKYSETWTSKAKKLRSFWSIESDTVVWNLLFWFSEYIDNTVNKWLIANIANRLKSNLLKQEDIEHIQGKTYFFNLLKTEIIWYIKDEKYIESLDRIHTLFHAYLLEVCDQLNIEKNRRETIDALLWKVKKNLIDSQKILVPSFLDHTITKIIWILEKFHNVRNNESLAHPNILLSYNDAKFVVGLISACLWYIDSIINNLNIKN